MGASEKQKTFDASKVFTPAAPVDAEKLFAGRIEQVRRVVDAVNQKGQHAMIFGERGVGKTSLANIISTKITGPVLPVRVNCDSTDGYASLWRKMFDRISVQRTIPGIGFGEYSSKKTDTVSGQLGLEVTPISVCRLLEQLSSVLPILIMDEFDRIPDDETKQAMADTIKTLSDNAVPATIVLVGVADSVDQLIAQHQSIERALVQIQMPRMSIGELEEIIDNGLGVLNMSIESDAKQEIALISRGLPHYTHQLALHAVRVAIDSESSTIGLAHVEKAILKALDDAQETTRSAYHKATMSARKDTIYPQVLLACALAKTDDLGYFAAGDLRVPLSSIMGKRYEIPSFSRHLNDFCEDERGPILEKTGAAYRNRFRFINPLMQPHILMQGKATGLVNKEKLDAIKKAQE